MLLLAGIFGAASGLIGTLVSAGIVQEWIWPGAADAASGAHLPTGPTIVLAGACIFLFSLIFAPKRGVVGRAVRLAKTRQRVADDHLLRSLYELGEAMSDGRPAIATSQLAHERRWTDGHARRVLARAARRGLVETEAGTVRLSPAGFATARRLTRAHRLWEHFLIADIDLAPDHVDRDADSVEHFLGDEILSRLERELATVAPGSLRADELPESPHELSGQSHDSTSTSLPGDGQHNQPERPS
jgi:manganese/zinc/iron transport system permease protein